MRQHDQHVQQQHQHVIIEVGMLHQNHIRVVQHIVQLLELVQKWHREIVVQHILQRL